MDMFLSDPTLAMTMQSCLMLFLKPVLPEPLSASSKKRTDAKEETVEPQPQTSSSDKPQKKLVEDLAKATSHREDMEGRISALERVKDFLVEKNTNLQQVIDSDKEEITQLQDEISRRDALNDELSRVSAALLELRQRLRDTKLDSFERCYRIGGLEAALRASSECVAGVCADARELGVSCTMQIENEVLDHAIALVVENAELYRQVCVMRGDIERLLQERRQNVQSVVLDARGGTVGTKKLTPRKQRAFNKHFTAETLPVDRQDIVDLVLHLQDKFVQVRSDLEDEMARRAAEESVKSFLCERLKQAEDDLRKSSSAKEDALARARADNMMKRQLAARVATLESELQRLRATQMPFGRVGSIGNSSRKDRQQRLPI